MHSLKKLLAGMGWQGLKFSVVPVAASPAAPARSLPLSRPADPQRGAVRIDLDTLRKMARNADFDAFRDAWPKAPLDGANAVSPKTLYLLVAETELAAGDHARLAEATSILINGFDAREGHYYQALSNFLRGQYDAAIKRLECTVYRHPGYVEAAVLLAKAFRDAGQSEAAWRTLEALLPQFDDVAIWSAMARLVHSQADFTRMHDHFQRRTHHHPANAHDRPTVADKNPLEYLALGALRVNNFVVATQVWEDLLRQLAASPPEAPRAAEPVVAEYSSRRAQLALIDLRRTLEGAGVPMFLVSGTLLGCVREDRLLGHDHDVDVGVWDNVDRDRMLSILRTAGFFYDQASRAPEIVRVKHVNGIVVDIFYHFRSPGDYWHRGVKIVWHNSPFGLATRAFLGEEFLIPDDYDKYLTENYGDWRTPKIDFDCAFDTPNAEVVNRDELLIHTYKMLAQAMAGGARHRVAFSLDRLKEMGRENFVAELARQLRIGEPA